MYRSVSLVLVLSLAGACGRKTDPLTPDSPRPDAVKDIKVVTRDNTAFLSWAIPTKNVEGKEMNPADIAGFRVFRAELDRERKRARYRQIAEIDLANVRQAEVRDGRVYWRDQNLRYGQTYSYRIRALSARDGQSQPSDEVRATPLLSLSSPKNPRAAGGDSQNTLTWDAVTTRADGSSYQGFIGYNVYRGTASGRQAETPVNPEPLRTNTYKDSSVVNNTRYYYTVRAVDSPTLPWKESLDSPEVSAVPRDMTPPVRPKGLTVVPGVGRIFLTWNENRERDLAGYYVYRSAKSGRERDRLTDKPINRTTFNDETVKPDILYYYVVTAVDEAGNESEASQEQKAYAEKLRR
jgi:fibronectin type 3 domain-containing protein